MSQGSLKRYFADIVVKFRLNIFIMFSVVSLYAVSVIYEPYIIKQIVNKALEIDKSQADLLVPLILKYLCLTFSVSFLWRIYEYFWVKFSIEAKVYIIEDLMRVLFGHSVSYFNNSFSGGITNKIKDIAGGVPDIIVDFIRKIYYSFFVIMTTIVGMYNAGPKFAMVLIFWISSMFLIIIAFWNKAKHLCEISSERKSDVFASVSDIIINIHSVILFATNRRELQNLKPKLKALNESDMKRDVYLIKLFVCQMISVAVYIAGCFYLLLSEFEQGNVTVGDFSLVFSLNIVIVGVLWGLSSDLAKFTRILGEVNQGFKTIFQSKDILDAKEAKDLVISKGLVEFKAVNFSYNSSSTELFKNKSLILNSGEKVGLVGTSGAGKSTFINLLMRFYDVQSGEILIDGQNIAHVTQESLRRNIGIIPQDPMLFHRSIMENIKYGVFYDTSEEEIILAAKKAQAHDFIMDLPLGYQTLVGERGVKLSGGQRQRIAIARAILKNAPILILDEATSSLDSVVERDIQKGFEEATKSKTTIIIAHRLSTLSDVDRILVFKNGQIIQDGPHLELIKDENGEYFKLWSTQKNGFI